VIQVARHDAEPGELPGRQDGAVWPPAVDLRGVHKHFGSVQAVRGVALTIGSREVMAFLGPNSAGKTSTIDMILGLSRPDAGQVEVYGMAPRQAVRKGLVSAVMQAGGLLKDLTVAETVQYTARLFAVSRPVGEVLERAGITAIAGRRVGKCSGENSSGCASPWR
jgi:ABC-2 type transport system ATP-binding protein